MAKNETAWGIDIGNSSLKAIRCRVSSEPDKIEAVGFDYIEHSKIMSQPGAEPSEILAETLKEFLARNTTKGDLVGISVSGQNTISRFMKLPPVDVKKVNDIIKYEAKQWLPFDLQDVIWDYQPLGQGLPKSGIVLDSEIGMFAMKRDIAMRTLAPYTTAGINLDCIQSSQLAVYNYIAYDQLRTEDLDPDNPPDYIIVLNVGTDSTDVIITNGFSIWTRNIQIGGNAFTKALTKSLKLTFSKAEHVKRNPTSSADPKAVIQAMRPVFNDMLSEVQRSIEYYSNTNRKAKYSKVFALGNAMKLPGLQRFLADNLSMEVIRPSMFNRLTGQEVVASPVFKENLCSFDVAYGLAIQLLGESALGTNLMPQDVVTERVIREKKPWALAAAASILLGLTVAYGGATRALDNVKRGEYDTAKTKADGIDSKSKKLISDTSSSVSNFKQTNDVGANLTGTVEGRIIWLEFFRALNSTLPVDIADSGEMPKTAEERTKMYSAQNKIYISSINTLEIEDATGWWDVVKDNLWYRLDEIEKEELAKAEAGDSGSEEGDSKSTSTSTASTSSSSSSSSEEGESQEKAMLDKLPPPPTEKKVRIVQLSGYHYHNDDDEKEMYGPEYLRRTICHALKYGSVDLPISMDRQLNSGEQQTIMENVTFKELGFMYPTVLDPLKPDKVIVLDPQAVKEQTQKIQRMQMLQRGGGGRVGGTPSGGDSGMMGGGGMTGGMMGGGGMMGMMGGGGMTGGMMGRGRGGMGGGMGGSYGGTFTGAGGATGGLDSIAGQLNDDQKIELSVYNFVIQFLWYETPPSERDRIKEEKLKEEMEAAGLAGEQEDEPEPQPEPSPEPEDDDSQTVEAPEEETPEENPVIEEETPEETTDNEN